MRCPRTWSTQSPTPPPPAGALPLTLEQGARTEPGGRGLSEAGGQGPATGVSGVSLAGTAEPGAEETAPQARGPRLEEVCLAGFPVMRSVP